MSETLCIEGHKILINDPNRIIWSKCGITKMEFLGYLSTVSPYMLPYTKDRLLMLWLFPQGLGEGRKKIEKRSLPASAPDWVCQAYYKQKQRMLLNNAATLAWAANYGALEFHVPFDRYQRSQFPTELIFDLDGPDYESFDLVVEVALKLKQVLDSLQLYSVVKTSGGTGLHIHVPIEDIYTFQETRRVNVFIARYVKEKYEQWVTLERVVAKRGKKVYFDYLQLWAGRTLRAPYSARANESATVASPVTWGELEKGIHPRDFTIQSMPQRIKLHGDYLAPLSTQKKLYQQDLKPIFAFLDSHSL